MLAIILLPATFHTSLTSWENHAKAKKRNFTSNGTVNSKMIILIESFSHEYCSMTHTARIINDCSSLSILAIEKKIDYK